MAHKEWLDANVVPLLGGLKIYSFLWNGTPPSEYLVWLNAEDHSQSWGPEVKRLLDLGFRFDFTRDVVAVEVDGNKMTLFGGDGTPFVAKDGRVSVRLFRKEENIGLILQVSCLRHAAEAPTAIREFFALFDTNPIEVCSQYASPWGQA